MKTYNIKELLKKLGIKEKNLAEFFGLKPKDYYNSSARKRYEESFIRIYSFLEGREKEKKKT